MIELLIHQGKVIAVGPFTITSDTITNSEAVYAKHLLSGWSIIELSIPEGSLPLGWAWDGQALAPASRLDITPVPLEISMGQAREALYRKGLLGTVQAAVDGLEGELGSIARIQWEFRSVVRRDWPLVLSMQKLLGWSDEQLDDLFRYANTL